MTFLFTDIEGSTTRWEHHPQQMKSAVERHDAIMRQAIEGNGGVVFRTEGDAFRAAFGTALPALNAAIQAQQALEEELWPEEVAPLRVRMALHTGAAELARGDYVGPSLNRMARLLAVAFGGQTLISLATEQLVCDDLPAGVTLVDMGEHRLKDLIRSERIYQVVAPGLPSEFPPLKTLANRPNNLPVQHTEFVGREKEVGEVARMMKQPQVRLLTLTGPGGTGKSRLALQVGAELLDDLLDGIFFVNLAPVSDPDRVMPAIAQSLGVKEVAGQTPAETLKAYLRDKQMLLLLDNFEQVAAAGSLVNELIEAAAELKVLVTSRVPLHIRGEKEYAVPPLTVPEPKGLPLASLEELGRYEAVRLFMDRAADVKPDFRLTADNAPAVAQICVRLDGLPLAVELAAARIKLLTPQAILARLEQRLKLLTGGARDLPVRQQTLRNAIEWSYDLLAEEEKELFRQMAVFVGGSTLEAAEAVVSPSRAQDQSPVVTDPGAPATGYPLPATAGIDVLDGLGSLVDKSLLRQVEGVGGEPRFVMLGTMREYAGEKLAEADEGKSGEAEELRLRHARFFLEFAEEAEPALLTAGSDVWLDRVQQEHDNLRAALQWCLSRVSRVVGGLSEPTTDNRLPTTDEIGLRLAGALGWFWYVRGVVSEGRQWLETAISRYLQAAPHDQQAPETPRQGVLSRNEAMDHAYAKALDAAGHLAWLGGDFAAARRYAERGLQTARELGDRARMARLLRLLAMTADFSQGDTAAARSLYEESLALHREVGNRYEVAIQIANLAWIDTSEREFASARSRLKEVLAIGQELGDKSVLAIYMARLGRVDYYEGDYQATQRHYGQALAMTRELGFTLFVTGSLAYLGYASLRLGDYERAAAYFREGFATAREASIQWAAMKCTAGLAATAGARGDAAAAARLFAIAERLRQAAGLAWEPIEQEELNRDMAVARMQLDEETWQREWEGGYATSVEHSTGDGVLLG